MKKIYFAELEAEERDDNEKKIFKHEIIYTRGKGQC